MRDDYRRYFPSRADASEDTYNSYLQAPGDDIVIIAERHGREDVLTKAGPSERTTSMRKGWTAAQWADYKKKLPTLTKQVGAQLAANKAAADKKAKASYTPKPVTYSPEYVKKLEKHGLNNPASRAQPGFMQHVSYQRRDPRTGKMVQVKGGREASVGDSRKLTPHHFDVTLQKKHALTGDETAKKVLAYVVKKKVKTEAELQEAVLSFVQENYDSVSPQAEGAWVSKILKTLFHHGAVTTTHPGDAIAYGDMRVRDLAMARQWVEGSNNTVGSVRLRVGVAKLFKQDVKRVTERARKNSSDKKRKNSSDKKRFDRMLAAAMKDKELTASVERVATLSQAAYKGQKTVVLHRAINAEQAAAIRKEYGVPAPSSSKWDPERHSLRGKAVELKCDNVTSLSENPRDAHANFAKAKGMTVRVEVPVSAIVMSYRAMPSTMSMDGSTEWEVVVATKGKLHTTIVADAGDGYNQLPSAPNGFNDAALTKKQIQERAKFTHEHLRDTNTSNKKFFSYRPPEFLQSEEVFS